MLPLFVNPFTFRKIFTTSMKHCNQSRLTVVIRAMTEMRISIRIRIFFFVLFAFFIENALAQPIKVLFVGNSYTMPLQGSFDQIANVLGADIQADFSATGGQTLKNHYETPMFADALDREDFDYVVLQEQSQMPSFPPSQVKTDVYPYAKKLVDQIRQKDSCIEPVFYMTWGRENGDKDNCIHYKPLCTYEGMQRRLRVSYMQMAADNKATVSPVGMAWQRVRELDSTLALYEPDESHPNLNGSYLAACVFYSVFTKKSPYGACEQLGMDTAIGHLLERVAASTVLDSLDTWRVDGNIAKADFSHDANKLEYTFTNTSRAAYKYHWDFGDGNTSKSADPVHTYAKEGEYDVKLVVEGACGKDSTTITVTAVVTGQMYLAPQQIALYPNPVADNLTLSIDLPVLDLDIFNALGQAQQVGQANSRDQLIDVSGLSPGVYLLVVRTSQGIAKSSFVKK